MLISVGGGIQPKRKQCYVLVCRKALGFFNLGPMAINKHDVKSAARYIGMSVDFLNRHRITGAGPAFLKLGGRIFYIEADLDAWLMSKRRSSTSEVAQPTG